jgi:C1A family cysteine protease
MSMLRPAWWCGLGAVVLTAAVPVNAELTDEDIERLREIGDAEGWTFVVGHNSATRRDKSELYGLEEPVDWQKNARFDDREPGRDLPPTFDWRDSGGLTPVRNQGSCGSCWAFAAVGIVESAVLRGLGESENLSEQWLVSCNPWDYGCDGGWTGPAVGMMTLGGHSDPCGHNGAVLETDFPYAQWDKPCNCPYPHEYWMDDWAYVGSAYGTPSVAQIKQAIYDHGPVAVAIYASDAMDAYNGGIFNACEYGPVNHAVVICGWDDTQGSNGVWFVRNSWGSIWGEGGYMRIEYGCNRVGYAACYVEYDAAASGIEHQLVEIDIPQAAIDDDPALAHARTFDLQVIITDDDDWTATGLNLTSDATFYNHAYGTDVPQPGFWPSFAGLAYDTFFSARDFAVPGFAEGPFFTGGDVQASWFDTVDTGNGVYTIGRFTLTSGSTMTVAGNSTAKNTGGLLHPFEFTINIAFPGIEHQVVEVPISPEAIADDPTLANARTYDLQVVITDDDDWTATGAIIELDGEFYQHPVADADVPQPSFWSAFPSLEHDTFFCSRDFTAPGFAEGPIYTAQDVNCSWFDTNNTGNGTYTIARFTVLGTSVLEITGDSTVRHTGGELHHFEFIIDVGQVVCEGDLNGDGLRDLADLGILLAAYEVDDGGDIDGDGDTDLADLGALLAVYDIPCP